MNKNKNGHKTPSKNNNNNNNNNNQIIFDQNNGHNNNNNNNKRRRGGKKSKNNANNQNNQNNLKNNNNDHNNHNIINTNNCKPISYASRSSTKKSSSIIIKNKPISVRRQNNDYNKNKKNDNKNNKNIHGKLSNLELLKIKMIQKNICYVAGLPKYLCKKLYYHQKNGLVNLVKYVIFQLLIIKIVFVQIGCVYI